MSGAAGSRHIKISYDFISPQNMEKGETPMKDTESAHKKVQEMIDCYATSDPLKEMSDIGKETDPDAATAKWIALAALHGVNQNAKSISIRREAGGEVSVTAKYRQAELPNPGGDLGGRIIDTVRSITHLEGEKAKTPLALGMRDGSLELNVKSESEGGGETITIKFPK
jgi:hypothetical protein